MNKFKTERKTLAIDDIKPNKWNPNVQSDFIFQKSKDSIKEYGFIDPVLVRKTNGEYQIIDGEHRWRAAKELGYTEIIVEDYGDLSDFNAMILTQIMNNTRGQDDILKRVELINQLEGGQTSLLPWTEEEIENQKKLLDFDFSKYNVAEDVEEKPETRTFSVELTTNQFKVLHYVMDLTKRKGEKEQLMELARYYMELRGGVDKFKLWDSEHKLFNK